MTRNYEAAGGTPVDDLLTVNELVKMSRFRRSTYNKWRLSWPDGQRRGPKPVRIEGRVFYRRGDFEAWTRGQTEAD